MKEILCHGCGNYYIFDFRDTFNEPFCVKCREDEGLKIIMNEDFY